jgi:cytochrome c oxidase subunit 2
VIPAAWLVVHFMNLSGAPASAIMVEIERTMFVFTLVSAPIMAITATVLLYSLFGWGRLHGDQPPMQENPAIRSNPIATIGWIGATSLLAAFLVIWGLVELAQITAYANGSTAANQQPNSQKPIDINVTGQQWVWTFEYPDQQKITSDVLVVPIDVPLYFNVTSKDVVHNFWVVELGVKIDANPGAITNTGVTPNKLGTFNIRCAELCGLHHAYMETQIKVVTQDQFDVWVREMGGKKTV